MTANRFHIWLSSDTKAKLIALAAKRNQSVSAVIEDALVDVFLHDDGCMTRGEEDVLDQAYDMWKHSGRQQH